MQSEQLDQLAVALAKFQAEMPAVAKGAVNPFFNSRYADLADVVTAAAPVASKHGLSVVQLPGHNDRGSTLTTWLLHESGQFIASEAELLLAKEDPQGQGSAMTYMRRYAYCAALGIVADADDDGNQAAAAVQSNGRTARQASPNKEASDKQIGLIKRLVKEQHLGESAASELIDEAVGRPCRGFADLSSADASKVIEKLNERKDAELVAAAFGTSEEPF